MNLVVFDQMVVAAEIHGHVRRVVDEVITRAIAHAPQTHRRVIYRVPAAEMVDMAILDRMSARSQRLTLAAFEPNTAVTGLIKVAPYHLIARSTLDDHAPTPAVADLTAGHDHIRAL